MTDSSSSGWRELTRPTESICPKLFYNFTIEADRFTIHLTDLVAIWVCSLDHDGIIRTSKGQRLSIDPSESNQQFRVLLEKLKQSLQSGNNHLARPKDETNQIIYLNTKTDLPKPLKPLSWTFELHPEDATELAEQLLRPCLHEASIAKQKIESLLRIIKDKDHVLSRLLEKIDNSSFDLSLIFPGITGLKPRKGRVTAKDAQRHVPGMSEFDNERWSSGFENDGPYTGFSVLGMHNLVTGCEKCPKHTTKQHSKWFEGLPVRGSAVEAASPDIKRPQKRKKLENDNGSTDTDSDFERQPTPPHLKKDNEVSAQDQSFSSTGFRPSKKAKLGKLGVSGARGRSDTHSGSSPSSSEEDLSTKRETEPPLNASQSATRAKAKPQASGSETETASEDEADPLSKQKSIQSKSQKASSQPSKSDRRPTGQRKLGRLQSHPSRGESSSTSTSTSPTRRDGKRASQSKQNEPQRSTQSPEGKKPGNLDNSTKIQNPASKPPPKTDSETESDPDLDLDDNNTSQLKNAPETNPMPKPIPSPNPNPAQTSNTDPRTSKTPSEPNTPSRRLGRVGKHRSESRSTSEANTPSKRADKSSQATHAYHASSQSRQNENDHKNETYSATDTDAESDSERDAGSPSPTPRAKAKAKPSLSRTGSRNSHSHSHSSKSTPVPSEGQGQGQGKEAEQVKPETAEERANRRRMELKQRLGTGSVSGNGAGAGAGGGIGGGAGRRKREF